MSDDDLFSKPKAVRGPNGRFVSKKAPLPVESSPQDTSTPEVKDTVSNDTTPYAFFDELSYYGEFIRRVYKNNSWFFVIEDMLPLAQITEPIKVIEAFKADPYYKESLDTHIFNIDIPRNNLGLSALTLADQEAVSEFIRLLRGQHHFFPGRFPEWIASTASIDFADAKLAQMQLHEQETH